MALRPDTGRELKECCAQFYGHEAIQWLVGGSFHPGGEALTYRLGESLHLEPGARILDVACGQGRSAILLAQNLDCQVLGIDYGKEVVRGAIVTASADALSTMRVSFCQGDAEDLPFQDESFDAIICECSLCLFPDKARALREMYRVLKSGGRLGIADLVLAPWELPSELQGLAGYLACVGAAQPLEGHRALIEGAGFTGFTWEDHHSALVEFLKNVRVRLAGAKLLSALGKLPLEVDLADVDRVLNTVLDYMRQGKATYALMVAGKE